MLFDSLLNRALFRLAGIVHSAENSTVIFPLLCSLIYRNCCLLFQNTKLGLRADKTCLNLKIYEKSVDEVYNII